MVRNESGSCFEEASIFLCEAAAGAASEEGIFLNCLQKLTAPGQLLRSACGQFFIGHKVHLFLHISLRRVLGIAAHNNGRETRGDMECGSD